MSDRGLLTQVRARRGAELKVLSAVETKAPGTAGPPFEEVGLQLDLN